MIICGHDPKTSRLGKHRFSSCKLEMAQKLFCIFCEVSECLLPSPDQVWISASASAPVAHFGDYLTIILCLLCLQDVESSFYASLYYVNYSGIYEYKMHFGEWKRLGEIRGD